MALPHPRQRFLLLLRYIHVLFICLNAMQTGEQTERTEIQPSAHTIARLNQ